MKVYNFILTETNNFVEVLFESLANHSYLPLPPIVEQPNTKPTAISPKEKKPRKPSLSEELNANKTVIEVLCNIAVENELECKVDF